MNATMNRPFVPRTIAQAKCPEAKCANGTITTPSIFGPVVFKCGCCKGKGTVPRVVADLGQGFIQPL